MSSTATTDVLVETPDPKVLDQLVPPPGPRWRRIAAWTLFVALLVGVCWLSMSGTASPHLDGSRVQSSGGSGPVYVDLWMRNDSPIVDIEVTGGPAPQPGLRLIGYGRQAPAVDRLSTRARRSLDPSPFPIRIGPGQSVELAVWFDVTDCAAIAKSSASSGVDLKVAIARGPFSLMTHTRTVGAGPIGLRTTADDQSTTLTSPDGWPAAIAQFRCGFQ